MLTVHRSVRSLVFTGYLSGNMGIRTFLRDASRIMLPNTVRVNNEIRLGEVVLP
jgi:hypothetical protein